MSITVTSIRRVQDMDADKVKFRGKGVAGVAVAGTPTDIDLILSEERLLEGGQVLLEGHAHGDYFHLEVVDVNNILGYGPGAVLDRFADTWYVDHERAGQPVVRLPYIALVIAGLCIRLKYYSTGSSNVNVRVNYFLHKPLC